MSDEVRATPIGDERVTTPESAAVESPYDGHVIARVPVCTPEHVERAVAVAKERLAEPLAPYERGEILEAATRVVDERNEELARIIAEEAAKPITTARTEAARAVETFRFAAIEARTLTGDVVPMTGASPGAGKLGFTLRVPVGVVGAISPFNFPLNLVAHKLAPAIAAGCPVVLKPASQTPLSAIRLVELLIDECGLPPGWINVVTGKGSTIGNALVDHDDVAMITFTGSPDVGWGIKGRAPRKKVGLELGNNAPVIIESDGAWEKAADKIKVAGYSHAGQSCISTQRVFVHRSLVDDFTSALVERVRTLKVGDPLDDDVDVSSLISSSETERVRDWIGDATAAGAKVAAGGDIQGSVLEPTVLTDVEPDMEVARNEVFGPVVGISAYDDLGDAIALANDTRYGLQAAIFTADLAKALRAVNEIDFGGVLVNDVPTFRTDQMPYGGVRDSGNTKEGPHYSVREMTRERLVVIQS